MSNGRMTDVIIKDDKYTDPRTGVEVINQRCFTVRADAGMKPVIEGIEGVIKTYNSLSSVEFSVYVDPRYDREFLKREIEAAILCAGEL